MRRGSAGRDSPGSDGALSHGDKNSGNGSKVWGNSVLSANFDAPIDYEDEIEIRQVAQMNELKQFLEANKLEGILSVVSKMRSYMLSLQELRGCSEAEIRDFFGQHADGALVSEEEISRLVSALSSPRPVTDSNDD